jgi:cytochrome c553
MLQYFWLLINSFTETLEHIMNKFFLLFLVIFIFSCNKNIHSYQDIDKRPSFGYEPQEAKKLMEKHCYTCHSPVADEVEGRIAPPFVAIKARYIDKEGYNRVEFIKAISEFVANPTDDNALLYGAVRKFDVMPKQAFPDSAAVKIAAFMYDYKVDAPAWFKEHWQGHGNTGWEQSGKTFVAVAKEKTFADIGLEYALGTQKVLGKNLMGTIQKKGTIEAMAFCNIQAIPLTDSMSAIYNAKIKRVSDKNRNQNNQANAEELIYIEKFKEDLAANKDPKPVIVEKGNKVHFYYPIPTNAMCLQCHGKAENIKPDVQLKIKALYPKDLATGYSENEVRGMWSIIFNKK